MALTIRPSVVTKTATLTFAGKITGQTFDIPHIARVSWAVLTQAPTDLTSTVELATSEYASIATQDGATKSYSTSTNGLTAQHRISFDILNALKIKGQIPKNWTVSDLKAVLKSLTLTWRGYGVGASGGASVNGARVKVWNPLNNTWPAGSTNNGSSPSDTSISYPEAGANPVDRVDSNGLFQVLVNSSLPSDGARPSAIFTDYVELKVEWWATPPSPTRNLVPLFTDPAWTKHANATASPDGKTLTLNATAAFQGSTVKIPAFPSTGYSIQGTLTGAAGQIRLKVWSCDANQARLTSGAATIDGVVAPGNISSQGTSHPLTRFLEIEVTSAIAGTFTFSNLTLTKALSTFAPAKARESFKELVVNGDFSQGATGWTVHPNASVAGAKLVLNATGTSNATYQIINATPNTTYRVTWTGTGYVSPSIRPRVNAQEYRGTTLLRNNNSLATTGSGEFQMEFTTGPDCNAIWLNASNDGAGTFTFDNISLKRKAP